MYTICHSIIISVSNKEARQSYCFWVRVGKICVGGVCSFGCLMCLWMLQIDENVQREIINHRSLRHPNIVRFKEVWFGIVIFKVSTFRSGCGYGFKPALVIWNEIFVIGTVARQLKAFSFVLKYVELYVFVYPCRVHSTQR